MEKEVKEEIKKAIAEAMAGNVAGKGEIVIREGRRCSCASLKEYSYTER